MRGRAPFASLFLFSYLQPLGDDGPRRGQHGPPGVQQLVGAVLLDLLDGLAEAERVVAVARRKRERGERVGKVGKKRLLSIDVRKERARTADGRRSTPHFACGCLLHLQRPSRGGVLGSQGVARRARQAPKREGIACGKWVGPRAVGRGALFSTPLPSQTKNSLAGQGAVQVGGHLGRVQQAAGQEELAVRACEGGERGGERAGSAASERVPLPLHPRAWGAGAAGPSARPFQGLGHDMRHLEPGTAGCPRRAGGLRRAAGDDRLASNLARTPFSSRLSAAVPTLPHSSLLKQNSPYHLDRAASAEPRK